MVELRAATSSDLVHIAAWIRSKRDAGLWAGWRVGFPIDLASLSTAIDFAEDNALCLFSGHQLVAFGQLLHKGSNRGHLARIIVNPAFRGKGLGEALVRGLLNRARAAYLEKISLNVDRSNAVAASLYIKMGFADAPRPPDEPETPGSRYMEATLG